MNADLEKLESLVEHEAQILSQLPAAQPSAECLAHLERIVRQEAARRRKVRRLTIPLGAAAAAVVMGALLLPTLRNPAVPPPDADDAAGLSLWAEAVDASAGSLAFLLEQGWLTEAGGNGTDFDSELETLFESFEQSFQHFQHL